MANPNPEIWGNSSSWIYSERAYGLETTISRVAKCDKPKIANFNPNASTGYKGSLLEAINTAEKMTINQYIDNSICPCGQDPTVSPYGKIALLNENNELSTTPSRVITVTDSNINWFFADSAKNSGNNNNYYHTTYTTTSSSRLGLNNEQFAPKAQDPPTSTNTNMVLCPYVYYGLKSLVLSIEVCCAPSTITNPTSGYTWRTLNSWKNDHSDEIIIGLRLFVRNCTAIDGTTLALTYNNDRPISSGQASFICVTNPININNNGVMTDTQLLSIFGTANDRSVTIFARTPQIYNYNDTRRQVAALPCWDYFDGQECVRYKPISSDPVAYFFYKIPYSDDTYEKIMKIAALYGCFFTPSGKYQFDNDMLDNDLYLPVLDENGVAHGQYTRGAANATNPLYSKNSIRDIDYDPTTPPTPVDTNTYNNTTVFNVIGAGASMNKRYLLDAANVAKLSTDLFDICDNMSTGSDYSFFDSKVKANMLTQSPIDSVVSLIRYPFTPTHGSTKQPVKLGRFEASAEGYPISNAIQTITFAGVDIFPRFGNNFLDYEPYTKYEVYVPFCDTVELSAADILGHTLNVRLVVDLFTGVCTGYILADSLCIETTSGNVGVSLPLTGLDTATINANIANAEANKKAAKKNYIKGHFDIITQKDKVGALWTQILGTNEDVVKKADYDLKHIETPMHTIGAASPLTSWAMDLNARIIIYYPTGDAITNNIPPELRDLTTYAHTTGFATIDNALLSTYSGFTVATNPILNFAATKTEKEMIESALNGGIFI